MSVGLRILACIALVGALFAAKGWYDARLVKQGYDKAAGEAKTRETTIRTDAADKLATATQTALLREKKLQDDLAAADTQRFKENNDHEKLVSALRARARAGDERLSIATRKCAGPVPGTAPGASTAVAPGPGDETRADLMPATVDALFSIAGGIANLVRDYNDVIDRYDRVRATCNAVTP